MMHLRDYSMGHLWFTSNRNCTCSCGEAAEWGWRETSLSKLECHCFVWPWMPLTDERSFARLSSTAAALFLRCPKITKLSSESGIWGDSAMNSASTSHTVFSLHICVHAIIGPVVATDDWSEVMGLTSINSECDIFFCHPVIFLSPNGSHRLSKITTFEYDLIVVPHEHSLKRILSLILGWHSFRLTACWKQQPQSACD